MFYAITSLAIKKGFATSKHLQLIGWFNKEFVATGLVDKRYGKILRNAYHNRTKGDYDAFVSFSKSEVELMHKEMIEFIEKMKILIFG